MHKVYRHEVFPVSPFQSGEDINDLTTLIIGMSKSSLRLMYFILSKNSFLEDKILFDIEEFNQFFDLKSDTSASVSLKELCSKNILARTRIKRVYWINKNVFYKEKEMELLENIIKSKKIA